MASAATATGKEVAAGFDWSGLGRAYLFFLYFSAIPHLLLQFFDATIFFGLRQSVVVSTLWLIPLLLLPRRTRLISALVGVVLWAFSLVSLGYFCVYQQEFSQSVIFIIFESNTAEAVEYFDQYFSWWMIPALLVYSAGAWLLWRRIQPLTASPARARLLVTLIAALLFVYPQYKQLRTFQFSPAVAGEILQKRFEPAVPWYQAMLAHSFIHAGGVLLITANWGFFLIELTAHFVIDKLKCDGHINFNQDQILHFMCKAGYVFATAVWFPLP